MRTHSTGFIVYFRLLYNDNNLIIRYLKYKSRIIPVDTNMH